MAPERNHSAKRALGLVFSVVGDWYDFISIYFQHLHVLELMLVL